MRLLLHQIRRRVINEAVSPVWVAARELIGRTELYSRSTRARGSARWSLAHPCAASLDIGCRTPVYGESLTTCLFAIRVRGI